MKSFITLPALFSIAALLLGGLMLGAYANRTQAQFGGFVPLSVPAGGTGWGAVQASALLYGNGTSRLATTTQGTPGFVLSMQGGIPTWVATTTFSSPLNYAAGNVTLSTAGTWSGNAGTASALANNGANCSAGNAPLGVDASGAVENCFDVWTEAENSAAAYINALQDVKFSTTSADFWITATSTLPSITTLVNLSTVKNTLSGLLAANAGVLYQQATSTLSATGPLTGSFVQVGSGGALGCTTASSGVAGCLSSSSFDTFNNKQATIGVTFPITLTGVTVGFGGLTTSTAAVQGNIPYFSSVNTFANVATGTLTGSGGVTVTAGTSIIGANASVACASCALFGYDWTPAAYNGTGVNATSTGLWIKTTGTYGLIASSTFFTYASTTQFSASDKVWLTNTKNGPLGTDSAGLVTASTTGVVTAGTGISLDSSVRQIFGGSLAITNSGVTSLTANSPLTRDTGTGAVTISCGSCALFGYDWTAATNYNVNTNSTTTPIWLKGAVGGIYSFMASNTAAFDQIIVGSSTTSSLATSTFFGNTLVKGTASSTALIVSNSPSGPLSTDSNGNVSASTTGLVTAGTGISLDNATRRVFGGGVAITNSGVTSAVAGSGITVSAGTGAVTFTENPWFTPGANYGVVANSTTTSIYFNGATVSLSASSTAYFNTLNTLTSTTTNASTTNESVSGTFASGGTGTTSIDAAGNLKIQNLTGLALTTNGTVTAYGGATCSSTNRLIQVLSASGVPTCAGDTTYPFPGTNSFGTTPANSTSTLLLLTGGLSASSTVRFGNGAVANQFTFVGTTGNLGLGTSSPYATLNIEAVASSTRPMLFAISSSTNSGGVFSTTTLFSVSNTGAASTTNFFGSGLNTCNSGNVLTWSGGLFGCAADATAAGAANPFIWSSDFAVVAAATSSRILATNGLSASSTVRFGNAAIANQFTFVGTTGNLGLGTSSPFATLTLEANASSTNPTLFSVSSSTNSGGVFSTSTLALLRNNGLFGLGTSTPWAQLSVNANVLPTGAPIFAIGSSSDTELVVNSNGWVGLATTSPWSRLTLGYNYLATGFASSSITVQEFRISTTTAKTIDARDGNTQLFQIGASATTITLTGFIPGSQMKLIVCNPNGTAGAITWATSPANLLLWPGGTAPSQTTTTNKCDVWSFIGTTATSTATANPTPALFGSLGKILGAQTPNF